jgi:hypothetical protein
MVDGSIDDLDETHSRIGSLHRTQTTRCRQHPSPEAADRTAYRGRPARERPEPSSSLGAQVSDLQRGSLWLAHRVVRAILRMAASGEADIRYLGGPARLAGVALYLAAKRPLDRIRKRFRPIRVTIAPPRTQHTLRPPPRRKH